MNGLTEIFRSPGWRRSLPEIVAAGIAAVMIMFEVWAFEPGGWTAGRTVAGLGAALSLAFLRRAPFAAYVGNGLSVCALVALGFPSDFYQWTNFVALLVVASRVVLLKALLGLAFGYSGVAYYFLSFPDEGTPGLVFAILAIWTAGWFAGRTQLARSREAQAKQENQVSRAELAAQRSRSDLEAERSRIARDLHDVVGHAVNVMVVHAGAGQGLTADDLKLQDVFRTIAATGRTALADLDRMLDVLQGNAGRSPVPGLAGLDELCGTVRSTGLDVELSLGDAAKDVSPSVGLTAYRIIQEALTNVIKHANATAVRVDVEVGADVTAESLAGAGAGAAAGAAAGDGAVAALGTDAIAITVRDNGTGGQPVPGRGLGGIAARAMLHGGSARYGPGSEGGFEVSVRLPAGSAT